MNVEIILLECDSHSLTIALLPFHVVTTDYQMAAVLLRLPSIIRSEVYGYLNPEAGFVYRTHIQMEDDQEARLDRLL